METIEIIFLTIFIYQTYIYLILISDLNEEVTFWLTIPTHMFVFFLIGKFVEKLKKRKRSRYINTENLKSAFIIDKPYRVYGFLIERDGKFYIKSINENDGLKTLVFPKKIRSRL